MKRSRNPPLTGTPSRMKTLPFVNISSLKNHRVLSPEVMKLQYIDRNTPPESSNRKCVYSYEDRYTFARILSSDSLVFDSHFESGNLQSAFRVVPDADDPNAKDDYSHPVYDLYMHNDVNTNGHTQWFYFSVSNTRAGQEATFCLRNYQKPSSLFNEGMCPLIYSHKGETGWYRGGTNVCYYANAPSEIKGDKKKKDGSKSLTYTMKFTYTFTHTNDTCYFAYCHPYTYTDMQNYLNKMQRRLESSNNSSIMRRSVLCKTKAGNICDLLTVTAPAATPEELNDRPAVVVTARVHPGESNSSWVMQGILDYLLGDCSEAVQLRQCFIFKIIPMLNPDGVINGNYRTNLSGVDLNRHWGNPDMLNHPTIFQTKVMVQKIKKTRPVCMIIDLHGHSHREGVFFYGCMPDRKFLRAGVSPINTPRAESDMMPGVTDTNSLQSAVKIALTQNEDDTKSISGAAENTTRRNGSKLTGVFTSNSGGLGQNVSSNALVSKPPPANTLVTNESSGVVPAAAPLIKQLSLPPGFVSSGGVLSSGTPSPKDTLNWRVRLFPRVLASLNHNIDLNYCSFKLMPAKASTMRIVMFTEFGIDCSYTVEASLGGGCGYHYGVRDLIQVGYDLCTGILEQYPCCKSKTKPIILRPSNQPPVSDSDRPFESLKDLRIEISHWRQFFNPDDPSLGLSLLSSNGLKDLTAHDTSCGADDEASNASSAEDAPIKKKTGGTNDMINTSGKEEDSNYINNDIKKKKKNSNEKNSSDKHDTIKRQGSIIGLKNNNSTIESNINISDDITKEKKKGPTKVRTIPLLYAHQQSPVIPSTQPKSSSIFPVPRSRSIETLSSKQTDTPSLVTERPKMEEIRSDTDLASVVSISISKRNSSYNSTTGSRRDVAPWRDVNIDSNSNVMTSSHNTDKLPVMTDFLHIPVALFPNSKKPTSSIMRATSTTGLRPYTVQSRVLEDSKKEPPLVVTSSPPISKSITSDSSDRSMIRRGSRLEPNIHNTTGIDMNSTIGYNQLQQLQQQQQQQQQPIRMTDSPTGSSTTEFPSPNSRKLINEASAFLDSGVGNDGSVLSRTNLRRRISALDGGGGSTGGMPLQRKNSRGSISNDMRRRSSKVNGADMGTVQNKQQIEDYVEKTLMSSLHAMFGGKSHFGRKTNQNNIVYSEKRPNNAVHIDQPLELQGHGQGRSVSASEVRMTGGGGGVNSGTSSTGVRIVQSRIDLNPTPPLTQYPPNSARRLSEKKTTTSNTSTVSGVGISNVKMNTTSTATKNHR